jgi:ABC-type sugar transport system permease subunit
MAKIIRKRLGLIATAIILLFSTFIGSIINILIQTPFIEWNKSWFYYIGAYLITVVVFIFQWSWIEAGEKDEFDSLGEKIDSGFAGLAKAINDLTNEIRQDRNERKHTK